MTDPTQRTIIAALMLTAAGLVGIAVDEDYCGQACPDPVKGQAVPTLGFGATHGVKMTDRTTPPKAVARLLTDVQQFEGALKRCVKVPLYQHEYDAYVNLAYNIGAGKSGVVDGFCWAKRGGTSTLVTRLNAYDYKGACDAILMWKKVGDVDCSAPGNKTCSGVWGRRLRLHRQCLGDTTGATQ